MTAPTRRLKLNVSSAMIGIGLLLLGYVSVQYGTMFLHQRKLEREWVAQQRVTSSQATTPADNVLTRLSIPKLEFSAVVVEGTGQKELLLGPGHMEQTPAPGSPGNSVITAHRDTFFRHIVDLSKGDQVLVERNGGTYTYEVAYKKIVKPSDVSVIESSNDARLTLITCYPTYYIGPAPERLVVVAKLVGSPAEGRPAKLADAAPAKSALPKNSAKGLPRPVQARW